MMIVLVPVSRFRVRYEVAAGFPYSQLDRVVLQAVGEGSTSISGLAEVFRVHPRLLIQSLVTLTHAGWTALGMSETEQFVLTLEGRQALKEDKTPESIVISPRRANVLFERATGTVIPEGEVLYVKKTVLQKKGIWESCPRLRAEITDNKLDESQVQHLLPRRQGERLRWIGPIEMTSKRFNYIPMDVDLETERVLNLPQRCETRLKPYVVERARQELVRSQELGECFATLESLADAVKAGRGWVPTLKTTPDLPNRDWPVHWSSDDLLCNTDQHINSLHRAFERAETSVLIASSVAEPQCLEQLKPAILSAMKRGVAVDLLWGHADDQNALKWMKKTAHDAKRDKVPGQLRFSPEPTSCNAKMILWDEGPNALRGVVGTYDWLARGLKDSEMERDIQFSMQVSHPVILSALSRCAAALWSGTRLGSLSSVPDRWRRIAADLEAQAISIDYCVSKAKADRVTMRVVLDYEHLALLQEWVTSAQVRLLIASAELDAVAEQRLLPACNISHGEEFIYRVLHGGSAPDAESTAAVRRTVERAAGLLMCTPRMGANILVSDLSACISSYSFLSQPSSGGNSNREIGLVVEGIELSDQIAEHLIDIADA